MNKKYLTIAWIILAIAVIAGGLWLYSQESKSPIAQSKCGDGICDAKEKKNPRICPQDCKLTGNETEQTCSELGGTICSSSQTCSGSWLDASDSEKCCSGGCEEPTNKGDISTLDYEDSPFGVLPDLGDYEISDMGVSWVRLSGKIGVWDLVEPNQEEFSWDFDEIILNWYNHNINIIVNIKANNNWANPLVNDKYGVPEDLEAYENFVKTLVERYDGDGIDDAPGSPIIEFWQIENEVDLSHMVWADTSENYVTLLETAYQAVKEANPKAKVLLSGMAGPDEINDGGYFDEILKYTDAFDIFDIHIYGYTGYYKEIYLRDISTQDYISNIRQKIGDKPIWATEVASFVGKRDAIIQTEKDQAIELIKRYVYYSKSSIEKTFWSKWSIQEANFWLKDGYSFLSYYTYKLMVEKLEGSDWDSIQTIQESDNVYIYKFIKNNEPIWVAWWDYFDDTGSSKTITIDVGSINSVKITEAVPKYETGQEVTNYSTAFNTETKTASNGKITITLGESPVFVEGN